MTTDSRIPAARAETASRTRRLPLSAAPLGHRSALRTPAVAFAFPTAVAAILFAASAGGASGYFLARASAANSALTIVGPFVAASAAWEMQTLRQLWGRWQIRRRWWSVLTGRLALVATSGLAVMVLTYLVLIPGPPNSASDLTYPALSILAVLSWTAAGAAIGLVAGRLIAVPLGLLVPYLAVTLPAGWEPLWMRHLTGNLFDCCSTSQVLDQRAAVASAAVLAAMAVVSLCLACVRLAPARATPAQIARPGVTAVIAVAAAAMLVAPATELGAQPVRERPPADLVCRTAICLWPEDQGAFDANINGREQILAAWERLGLPQPQQNFGPVAAAGLLPVTTTSREVDQTVASMAQTLPRALLGCQDDYADEQRNSQIDLVTAVLITAVGHDPAAAGLSPPAPAPGRSIADLWSRIRRC